MELTVPVHTDESVRKFAKKISGKQRVLTIPRCGLAHCDYGRCYLNVDSHTIFNGGGIALGWAVRRLEGVFLEAEQHAVWRSPDNQLIDITPHQRNETVTCFVPDANAKFSDLGGASRPNQYFPICRPELLEEVQELIEIVTNDQKRRLNAEFTAAMGDSVFKKPEFQSQLISLVERAKN